jgi:RHS repeat-associated protein
MQMQLSSDVRIPDGLLAANALLAENSRQGSATLSHTLHQGFYFAISSTSLGISGSLYDGRTGCRYTGKERDSESGNDYFGARYFASNMGRFTSPDWSAEEEPVPYAKLGNPQTLNLYAYVGNNPMSRADIDGHTDEAWLEEHAPQVAEANAREEGVFGGAGASEQLQNAAATSRAAQQQTYGKQADGSYKADPAAVKKAIAGGKAIGSGECVALCRFLSGAPNSGTWTAGQHAAGLTDADIGTAIATFDSSGHYPSDHDPMGKNSAIYMGRGTNGSIWVVDQWPVGDGPPGTHQPFLHEIRNYAPDNNVHPLRSNNADAYYVIRVP